MNAIVNQRRIENFMGNSMKHVHQEPLYLANMNTLMAFRPQNPLPTSTKTFLLLIKKRKKGGFPRTCISNESFLNLKSAKLHHCESLIENGLFNCFKFMVLTLVEDKVSKIHLVETKKNLLENSTFF